MPLLPRGIPILERNLTVQRRSWISLSTGVIEPVLFLLGIGYGLGASVHGLVGDDASSYAEFVAPALLAVSAMNGAVADGCYGFFVKLHLSGIYRVASFAPVRPYDIACGEILSASVRAIAYALPFVVAVAFLAQMSMPRVLLTAVVACFLGVYFSAISIAIATLIRRRQQFEFLSLAILPLFLFSGVFVPVSSLPPAISVLIELTPLYHAISLVRGTVSAAPIMSLVPSTAYIVAVTVLAVFVASRRTQKILTRSS
ncbi:ABC transporter permease [Kribbella sp. NPDC056345]|uniref:ABC transporter permease n=1 Tax=Kribbella sp. NPDC056345 TaxID=3345789 RepID=UPI0035E1C381